MYQYPAHFLTQSSSAVAVPANGNMIIKFTCTSVRKSHGRKVSNTSTHMGGPVLPEDTAYSATMSIAVATVPNIAEMGWMCARFFMLHTFKTTSKSQTYIQLTST